MLTQFRQARTPLKPILEDGVKVAPSRGMTRSPGMEDLTLGLMARLDEIEAQVPTPLKHAEEFEDLPSAAKLK